MKKTPSTFTLSLFLTLCLSFGSLNAQTFEQGDVVLSFGLGLGNTLYGSWGAGYSPSLPVVFLAGDYCLREDLGPGNLGIGAIMAYSSYKYSGYDERFSTFYFGGRGTYHFTDLVDKMDLYGGLTIGGRFDNNTVEGLATVNPFMLGIFGGARYYFADNLAAMGELGYDISWIKLGLSIKF